MRSPEILTKSERHFRFAPRRISAMSLCDETNVRRRKTHAPWKGSRRAFRRGSLPRRRRHRDVGRSMPATLLRAAIAGGALSLTDQDGQRLTDEDLRGRHFGVLRLRALSPWSVPPPYSRSSR